MWKNISLILGGIIVGFVLFLKTKSPDIMNVTGDYVKEQKVKDNRKLKNK
jgi:hypothetical protein